ncbi:MAG: hypothetical protein FWC26_13650 [Fibromonadales bacterium]|nr:hypothetical protein [Fibromonadales bacterium]
METLLSTQIMPNFSKIAASLQKGKRFGILYGKTKKPVAMLVPFEEKTKSRKIGILEGKASFSEQGNGRITEEEFLGL